MNKRILLQQTFVLGGCFIIALNVCSCTRYFNNEDTLDYLLRLDLLVNGEGRCYELPQDIPASRHYSSYVLLSQTYSYEPKAQLDFFFSTIDIPRDKRDEDFEFGIVYTGNDSCFTEGKHYQLTENNARFEYGQLEEGWFSLSLPQEPGLAFSIVFDMSFTPYDGHNNIYTISGTIEVTKDFIGYTGTKDHPLIKKE